MITTQNTRDFFDSRQQHVGEPYERSIGRALYGLVKYELAFGGQLANDPKTDTLKTLRIRTRVFATQDTVTYTGPDAEMLVLHAAVYLWYKARHEVYDKAGALHEKAISNLTEVTGGMPLLIVNFHEQIMLGHIVPTVILMALGLQDKEQIKQLSALYEKDSEPDKDATFKAAVELLCEGTPVEDVLEVACV